MLRIAIDVLPDGLKRDLRSHLPDRVVHVPLENELAEDIEILVGQLPAVYSRHVEEEIANDSGAVATPMLLVAALVRREGAGHRVDI